MTDELRGSLSFEKALSYMCKDTREAVLGELAFAGIENQELRRFFESKKVKTWLMSTPKEKAPKFYEVVHRENSTLKGSDIPMNEVMLKKHEKIINNRIYGIREYLKSHMDVKVSREQDSIRIDINDEKLDWPAIKRLVNMAMEYEVDMLADYSGKYLTILCHPKPGRE